NQERTVVPILMGDRPADSLLVCEVLTPGGHWSSYPPHKHDRDAMPEESFLEETYYHRVNPARGFALQRVYTAEATSTRRWRCTMVTPCSCRAATTLSLPRRATTSTTST